MADGRHIGNDVFGHDSAEDCSIFYEDAKSERDDGRV